MILIQALLEDRFQLRFHRETRELPVFNLVVAKGGSKLKQNVDAGAHGSFGTRGGPPVVEMYGTNDNMENLIRRLASIVGRPITDKTNIAGKFDFTMKFAPQALRPGPPDSSTDSTAPDVFTALQEQLGLKLESAKGPVKVLVIDSVERPTEN